MAASDIVLDKFRNSKIAVLGDPLIDLYVKVKPKKISRETPSVVFEFVEDEHRLGGALNTAANIDSLKANHKVIHKGGHIYTHHRMVCNNKLLFRYDENDTYKLPEDNTSLLEYAFAYYKQGYKTLIVSDYGKGNVTEETVKKLVRFANKTKDFKLIIDPYIENAKWYTLSKIHSKHKNTYLTPNEEEYKAGCKGGDYTLITLAEKGMKLKTKKKDYIIPAIKKEVYDATGAGDTVTAVFALCLDSGISVKQSAEISNGVASIVVSKFGTATVSPKEFKDVFRKIY
jgi:bifunctional ADP-heptose synthase (sugar kinase/adenylyltransferase)